VIFTFVEFRNYRPYYGVQRIDLFDANLTRGPYKKNIVLIGGLNGAGKTSLINSIFVCLYGRRFFSQKEYDEISRSAINKRFYAEGGRTSAVTLGLRDGNEEYEITVRWTEDPSGKLTETRTIYFVDTVLGTKREISSTLEEFNEFIDQRIPIDIAPFFIFDAEKIRDLVGEHEKEETRSAIQRIVSLDLYRQLAQDLHSICYRESMDMAKYNKQEEVQQLAKKLEETTNEYDGLKERAEKIKADLEELKKERYEVEFVRRQKIANSSRTKAQISKYIGETEANLKKVEEQIERFGKETLPFLVLSDLISKMKDRLQREAAYLEHKNRYIRVLAPYNEFMNEVLNASIEPPLTQSQKQQLIDRGKVAWSRLNNLKIEEPEDMPILHDVSPGQRMKLMQISPKNYVDVKRLVDEQHKLTKRLKELNSQLDDAPDSIDTHEEDERLQALDRQIGALNSEYKSCAEKIKRLQDERQSLMNELTRRRENVAQLLPRQRRVKLLQILENATREYLERITVLKARQLKVEIESILKRLIRKSDLARVEFDPEDYILKIYDENNNLIDLAGRSEGEKQIIALCMIWALTKVANADMPFVIDTPLARLDSIHRANIVNQFFVNLSEQVIILSTDTEITEDFLSEISPFIMKSYVLEYNDSEGYTQVREGYFEWV
jgi:DNA sulfur modification protein DndD